MDLRVKQEYLNYGIGGGKMGRTIILRNMKPEDYETYYKSGYSEFFYVVEPIPLKKKKDEPQDTILGDTILGEENND